MENEKEVVVEEEQPVEETEVSEEVVEPVEEASEEESVEETVEQNSEEEVPVEEPVVEEPVEVVEEPVVEEEVAVEEPVEEEAPVEEELSEKEKLQVEIQKTREELGVLNEVRTELIAAYAKNRELEKKVESLSKELLEKSESVGKLNEQLSVYAEAEKRLEAKKRSERVESLSQKFSKLGQTKTVEELSAKDNETLSEYETIVDAALQRIGESSESESLTAPSQSTEEVEPSETHVEETVSVPKAELEKLRTPDNVEFFANLARRMTKEQTASGRVSSYY